MIQEDKSATLATHNDQTLFQPCPVYELQAFGKYANTGKSSTLQARDYKGATDLVLNSAAVDCRNGTENTDVNGTLQAKANGGTSLNTNNVVRQKYLVRRLTPLECERLQGFPDGWTLIGEPVDSIQHEAGGEEYIETVYAYENSAGKQLKTTDSARYKALGNSIALPPWAYVLQKLSLCCGVDHTMASLFDGIGGFPLIWGGLHGNSACVWASEIEEFPIAVTKERFPEQE